MNKRQKEVIQLSLEDEKQILETIKRNYTAALADIKRNIRELQSNPLTQSKAYRLEFQKQLERQLTGILDTMQGKNFSSIAGYLNGCYTNGFIGTMYDLHGQGVPLILPINQNQVLKAVMKTGDDIKIANKRGISTNDLKKHVLAELQRGFASNLSYTDIARNISNYGQADMKRANTIARTEGHRVQNEAKMDALHGAKEKGADIVKQWDATLDGNTRETHSQLDGQIRELDEPFEVGGKKAMSPGAFGDPAEDCNCRCCILQRARWAVEDESTYQKWNNETGGIIECSGYADFKEKYLGAVDKLENNIDYMSKSFRPEFSDSRPILFETRTGINNIKVKKVSNSKFNMVTDDFVSRRNKAVRLTEKILSEIEVLLPDDFEIPQIAVVDFDINSLNSSAIGGYDKKTGILYLNSKYNTLEKILKYINSNDGQFANKTQYAPILHELGHKYYEDNVKSLAISKNIEYNKAKDIIDGKLYDYVHSKNNDGLFLENNISYYAGDGFSNKKYTEIVAECFSVCKENIFASDIINILRGDGI